MGQPVAVIEKPTALPGVIRYEINRPITGMDHEIFRSIDDVVADRWIDTLARRLFERGGIKTISANSNGITVTLLDASPPGGIKEIIEELFIYYRPGVEVVIPEGAGSD